MLCLAATLSTCRHVFRLGFVLYSVTGAITATGTEAEAEAETEAETEIETETGEVAIL